MFGWKLKALAAASCAAVLIALGWAWHSDRQELEAVTSDYRAAQAQLAESQKARKAEEQSARRAQALANTVQEDLTDAENRYDRAIGDAISNSAGLFIGAECSDSVPETSAATSGPDAARARLDRSVEVRVRRLERDARRAEIMITGLQKYINSECSF